MINTEISFTPLANSYQIIHHGLAFKRILTVMRGTVQYEVTRSGSASNRICKHVLASGRLIFSTDELFTGSEVVTITTRTL